MVDLLSQSVIITIKRKKRDVVAEVGEDVVKVEEEGEEEEALTTVMMILNHHLTCHGHQGQPPSLTF